MKIFSWKSLRLWAALAILGYITVTSAGLLGILKEPSFAILNRLFTGAIISFLFYYLVVHLPENRRRKMIVDQLLAEYKYLKEELATQLVFASQAGGRKDLSASTDVISHLMTIDGFTELLRSGREGNEGMYAVANGLDRSPQIYRDIRRHVELFTVRLRVGLGSIKVDSPEVYSKLSQLERFLTLSKTEDELLGNDRMLFELIGKMFSGWDYVEGQHNEDRLEVILRAL